MAETIDSLEIKINATADNANKAVDVLVTKLTTLTNSLTKVQGINLTGFTNNIKSFAEAAHKLTGIDSKKVSSTARALKNLGEVDMSRLDSGKINAFAQSVGVLSQNLSKTPDLRGISSVINSIKNLASVDTTNFDSKKIGAMAKSINFLASSLSAVPNVSNITGLVDAIKGLSKVDTANLQTEKIEGVSRAIAALTQGLSQTTDFSGVKSLISAIKSLTKIDMSGFDSTKIESIAKSISTLATTLSQITGLENINATINAIKNLARVDMGAFDGAKLQSIAQSISVLVTSLSTVPDLTGLNATINAIKNLVRIDTSGFDSAKIQSIANTISSLAAQLSGVGAIEENVIRLVNSLARLASSGQYISNVSQFLPVLGNEIVSLVVRLSNVNAIDASINKLVDGLAKLAAAGRNIETTVRYFDLFGLSVANLIYTLNRLPRVNTNIANLIQGLGNLAASGNRASNASSVLSRSLSLFSNSANTARKHSFSLASAIGKVYATYWLLFRLFGKIKNSINIASSLVEVQNVVDVTFGKMSAKVNEFAQNSIEQLGMSELSFKEYASRFQAMGSAMGINKQLISDSNKFLNKQTNGYVELSDSMADVSLNLTKLAADMASFYNVEQKDVAEDLTAVFTGQTRPLRKYGLDLTQATLKEWALKNGLDANIKSMSQAEKTMLRYRYVLANTGAAQNDFTRTAHTWANQTRILKENLQQLGNVIGGTFINILKPLVANLNVAVKAVTNFAKIVSESLGKIFGWTYEDTTGGLTTDFADASGYADDLADSTGTAADNIKKMKTGIRAFDELKVINESDKSGSGGGSGAGAGAGLGGGAAGMWNKTESMLKRYESLLDTPFKLGSFISSSIIDSLQSIDWEAIKTRIRKAGSQLAEFLNGIFAEHGGTTLFGELGRTIAESLNTAIQWGLSFGINFDWKQFGKNFSDAINRFFYNLDATKAAELINVWVQGIWDAIKTALQNIDWKYIINWFKEFLSHIDLETWGIILKFMAASAFIKGLKAIPKFYMKVFDAALNVMLQDMLRQIRDKKMAQKMARQLDREILALPEHSQSGTLIGKLSAWWAELGAAFKNLGGIKGLLFTDVTAVGSTAMETGILIASRIVAGIAAFFAGWNFGKFLYEKISNEDFPDFSEIFSFFTDLDTYKDTAKFVFDDISDIVKSFGLVAEQRLDEVGIYWNDFTSGLWTGFQTNFGSVLELFEKGISKISEGFSGAWTFIQNTWSSLSGWFKNSVIDPISNGFGTMGSTIQNIFDTVKNAVKNGVAGAFNGIISAAERGLNFIIGKVNGFLSTFNTIISAVNRVTSFNIGSIPTVKNVTIPRLPTYATGGFPEDGFFFANHNELVGGFTNGRTAVANNEQIVAGISNGVKSANYEMQQLLAQAVDILTIISEKEYGISSDVVFNSVRDTARRYTQRTGKLAFNF